MSELNEIIKELAEIVEPKEIEPWLDQPNPAFGNKTPRSLIKQGNAKVVLEAIYRLQSGEPS